MHTYVTIIIKRKGTINESGGVGGLGGGYLRGKKQERKVREKVISLYFN